jgi:hypothetical protein
MSARAIPARQQDIYKLPESGAFVISSADNLAKQANPSLHHTPVLTNLELTALTQKSDQSPGCWSLLQMMQYAQMLADISWEAMKGMSQACGPTY